MNEQFECLNQTPYEKRILHFDATGGFVSLNSQQTRIMTERYNRILTYFLFLKHFDYIGQYSGGKAIGDYRFSLKIYLIISLLSPFIKVQFKLPNLLLQGTMREQSLLP